MNPQARSPEFAFARADASIDPTDAVALHRAGRLACAQGRHEEAIRLYNAARIAAPDWPDPAYDAGVSHVLLGNLDAAEESYRRADNLFPRGFYNTKARLDAVRRERRGDVPAGTTRKLLELDWVRRHEDRRAHLMELTTRAPQLPQAWLELSKLERDARTRLRDIEIGLRWTPDAETRGHLLVERALALYEAGERDKACMTLRHLVDDEDCTVSTEEQAHILLSSWGPHLLAEMQLA